jgi:hypothetical protein
MWNETCDFCRIKKIFQKINIPFQRLAFWNNFFSTRASTYPPKCPHRDLVFHPAKIQIEDTRFLKKKVGAGHRQLYFVILPLKIINKT